MKLDLVLSLPVSAYQSTLFETIYRETICTKTLQSNQNSPHIIKCSVQFTYLREFNNWWDGLTEKYNLTRNIKNDCKDFILRHRDLTQAF